MSMEDIQLWIWVASPAIVFITGCVIASLILVRRAWLRRRKARGPGATRKGRKHPDEKAAVKAPWKEWVPWFCIVGGWSLITVAIAALTSWVALLLGYGILLLLAGGLRPVALIFWEGFYAMVLDLEDDEEEDDG